MDPRPGGDASGDAPALASGDAAGASSVAPAAARAPFPVPRAVGAGAPLRWLARGAADFRACPWPCLFYGGCFAAMGWLLGALLRSSPGTMMALTAGFLLVGPFLAMGLYEVARRRELGLPGGLAASTVAWERNLMNIAILGIGLGVLLALWARASMMAIAIAFPRRMPDAALLIDAIAAGEHLGFVAAWGSVGLVFAALVFVFTAVAIPLMLDRGTDAITAMLASAAAVARSPAAMSLWAFLIATLTVLGFATLFVGLVVVVPWIGLATWHAYRDTVEPAAGPPAGPPAG